MLRDSGLTTFSRENIFCFTFAKSQQIHRVVRSSWLQTLHTAGLRGLKRLDLNLHYNILPNFRCYGVKSKACRPYVAQENIPYMCFIFVQFFFFSLGNIRTALLQMWENYSGYIFYNQSQWWPNISQGEIMK